MAPLDTNSSQTDSSLDVGAGKHPPRGNSTTSVTQGSRLGWLWKRSPDEQEKAYAYDQPSAVPLKASGSEEVGFDSRDDSDVAAAGPDNNLEQYYAPISTYEGRHRYDPNAKWTAEEENGLVRRLDLRICSWVCLMFFSLQLDRANITQALSDNMLDDLKLTTDDYNTGMTIFYLCFLVAELPSNLISKKLGPDNWIPIQMIAWSVIAACQALLKGRGGFLATRALMGFWEGGFIPDSVLYLSYFYKSKELPVRLAYFWGAYGMTFIVSAFLAYGILHLRGYCGLTGWQWLFALEGSFTALLGILSWLYLPPSPTQTASKFRGAKGWFSPREETIMVNRIIRDDPSKGDMHNRQSITLGLLWEALTDYDMWPVYLLGLSWNMPQNPSTSYITLILKSLSFDTFKTNLLTIPAYALFIVQLVFWSWLSERINNRMLIVLFCQFWMLPLIVALEVLPDGQAYVWGRYILVVLMVGFPYVQAIIVSMTSRNAGSVRTRTVGSALYNMCLQASNMMASNVYRTKDAPLYRTGNAALLGIIGYNVLLIIGIKLFYMWRNHTRDLKWNAMTQAEKEHYLRTTNDRGNKRLDFRFVH